MSEPSGVGERQVSFLRRKWLPLAAGFALVGLVILVLDAMPTINDPTEGVFPLRVRNDLSVTVRIARCRDPRCQRGEDSHKVAVGSDGYWQVRSDASEMFRAAGAGTSPRCLRLKPSAAHPSLRLSQFGQCP